MDRKRITGPEVSVIPLPELHEDKSDKNEARLMNDDGSRADGRNAELIRPLFVKTGVISQANGSAYIEMANTKLMCAVYGPRPDRRNMDQGKGTVAVDFRFATFASPVRRQFQKDSDEKALSVTTLAALLPSIRLETFPKSSIDIFITVLENDGTSATLGAAITCASLALADAGIEQYDLVAGSAAGFAKDRIIMDCTLAEEKQLTGSLLLSYMTSVNEVTQFTHTGHIDPDTMAEATDYCIDACTKIHSVMVQCLTEAAAVTR